MFPQRGVKIRLATATVLFAFALTPCVCRAKPQTSTTAGTPSLSPPAVPAAQQGQATLPSASPYGAEIAKAWKLFDTGKADDAEKVFRSVEENAKQEKNTPGQAEARLGLCAVDLRHANYPSARGECEQAMALFDPARDHRSIARTQMHLGLIAYELGDNKSARNWLNEALKGLETSGSLTDRAQVRINLTFAIEGYPERLKLDTEALELARQAGDKTIQAEALHGMGQWLFVQGDSNAAQKKYEEAVALLGDPENKVYLGRVLLSEGRLQRAHGEMDRAIEIYTRALKLSDETGDKQGAIQIMNAMGACYGDQKKICEALAMFQRALDLAQNTDSPRLITSLKRNIAEAYIDLGENRRGADILEDMNRQTPDPFPYSAQFRYATLALAYQNLGEFKAALAAASKAVDEAKAHKNGQFLSEPLMLKAHAEEKLGENEAALVDVREALGAIEELRAHLVSSDFMKRGFAEKNQEAFNFSIELLDDIHRPEEALEVAEQARSRAFLDLLATHQVALRQRDQEKLGAPASPQQEAKNEPSSNPANSGMVKNEAELATRGTKRAAESAAPAAEPELLSSESAGSASLKQIQEQAGRLHSTLLCYWVRDYMTFVWVMNPQGSLHSARIPVKREHLIELIRGVWPIEPGSKPAVVEASRDPEPKGSAPNHGSQVRFEARGKEGLAAEGAQKDRWRELYRLLVEPVEAYLPTAAAARVTVIPHGPLFDLPFAGLRDSHDRYFLERYTLQYAPAISVLRFTGANPSAGANVAPRFLLVADPAGMQKLGLPQLPGSRREVADVARHLPVSEVTLLTGAAVQGERVRAMAAKSTVIHLATHGIVDDSHPFESFLALSDGKLTARDIYGLNLNADLVFLSACRSGMGKVTGDGVLGLTRAFLYAGTRSVVATLWDVADEPTAKLVADFYRNVSQTHDRAQALRSAQLGVLQQLRAGKMLVTTPRGTLTLPENPVFWASFVLIGEP